MTLDLIVLGLVLFFAALGALAGGFSQLAKLASLAAAAVLARPLGIQLGPLIAPRLGVPRLVAVLGVMVLGFFALYAAFQALARAVTKKILASASLGRFDRLVGFLIAGGKAAFTLYVVLSALLFFERPFATFLPRYRFDARGSKVAQLVRAHDLFAVFAFPGLRGLRALGEAAADPDAAARLSRDPRFQALMKDPPVQQLLADGALRRSLARGDDLAVLRNPRVLEALTDPRLQARLADLGASEPRRDP